MKKKTETMLCSAFMELLRKYPFSKITIQKIAGQCGVNRQTFYYYFDNIYDLMIKAFEYELVKEGHIYEDDSWEAFLHRFLGWMKDNRVIIKNILSNVESKYLRQAIYPLVYKKMDSICRRDSAEKIPEDGEGNDMEKDKFVIHFLVLGVTQYILEWAESDFKEDVEDVIDKLSFILKRAYERDS